MSTDAYLSLAQAAKRFPIPVSLPTTWRWAIKGVRGVKLKTQVIGGRRFTKNEWIEDFVAQSAVTNIGQGVSRLPAPSSSTAKVLQQAGIAVIEDVNRSKPQKKQARQVPS
jgi:hypothetical protein